MGCCFSTPAGPNAPYPGGAPNGSSRAINSPRLQATATEESTRHADRPTPSTAAPPHHRRRSHGQPLSQHIDKPLRRHVWVAKERTWTRAKLRQERIDFFDTRVTGRQEIWQTIRTALEVIWDADPTMASLVADDDSETNTALATAQSILRAAEITLPTGDLANGVYDTLGTYYALPEWIVSDPVNAVDNADEQHASVSVDRKEDLMGGEETAEEAEDEETIRRREEKGKAVATVVDTIKVRARLSENGQDVIVHVASDELVKNVIRKIAREADLRMPPPPEDDDDDDDDGLSANNQPRRWSLGINGDYDAGQPYGYFDHDRHRTLSPNSPHEPALSATPAHQQSDTVKSLLQAGSEQFGHQQTFAMHHGDLRDEYDWWAPENWNDFDPYPDFHPYPDGDIYNDPDFWSSQPLQAEDGYHVPDHWGWGMPLQYGDDYYTPENWSSDTPPDLENGLTTTTTSPGRWSPGINGDYDAHETNGYFDLGIAPNTQRRRCASYASRDYAWHGTPARQQFYSFESLREAGPGEPNQQD